MDKNKISLLDLENILLKQKENVFIEGLRHGTMRVELYIPNKIDYQQPHDQDELYFIISGSGILKLEGNNIECKENDVIFVPAKTNHMFENFTNNFKTYVVFYGKNGGEKI